MEGYQVDTSIATLESNYVRAIGKGILKVMSKIGISTLQSYRGAQIFEAVGLSQILLMTSSWTPTRIEGLILEDIEEDILERHRVANSESLDIGLKAGGDYHWRREGEAHLHGPEMIAKLQNSTKIRSRDEFESFCKTVDHQSKTQFTLRGLMKFKEGRKSIPRRGRTG